MDRNWNREKKKIRNREWDRLTIQKTGEERRAKVHEKWIESDRGLKKLKERKKRWLRRGKDEILIKLMSNMIIP